MSGPIRKVLGPAKARAKALIEKEPETFVSRQLPAEQELKAIADARIKIRFDIDKLEKAVELLNSKDRDWCQLIQNPSMPEPDRQKEDKLYTEAINDAEGHFSLIMKGQDKLSTLKAMVLELDYLYESAERKLAQQQLRHPTSPPTGSGPSGTHAAANSQSSLLKLPKVELPKFNGDPLMWKSFWDLFSASVDSQPISKVQKFGYLSLSLTGSAASAIRGFAVTEQNYQSAVDTLKKRFGDESIIISSLYSQLRNLRPSSNKPKDLRKFLDALDSVLRQLESVGENPEQSGLVDLVRGKLPADILLELQKLKPPDKATWSMQLVRELLQNVVQIQEEICRIADLSFKSKQGSNSGSGRGAGNTSSTHDSAQQEELSSSASSLGVVATGGGSNRTPKKIWCIFCDGDHSPVQCAKYVSADDRYGVLKQKGIVCFRCLKKGHTVPKCRNKNCACSFCKSKRHHSALCNPATNKQSAQASTNQSPKQKCTNATGGSGAHATGAESNGGQSTQAAEAVGNSVAMGPSLNASCAKSKSGRNIRSSMLHTARTKVQNSNDPQSIVKNTAQLFLDSGAQKSFITTELVKKLNLKSKEDEELTLYTFTSETAQRRETKVIEFEIILRDGSAKKIIANAMPHLTCRQQRNPLSLEDKNFVESSFEESFFADVLPTETKVFSPDVIIGQDYFWDFILDAPKVQLPSGMYAIPSTLGFLLGGKQELIIPNKEGQYVLLVSMGMNQALDELKLYSEPELEPAQPNLEDFWSLESVGINDPPDVNEDDVALQHFNDTVVFQEGRYYVKWPWRIDSSQLPDNKALAYKQFGYLMNRFKQDPSLLEKYRAIIDDQEKKDIIEPVFTDTMDGRVFHYLPHHPVITPQKATTKVRIVFNASARMKGHLSLNDCLFRGQVLLPDLCGLLLRFRKYPVAVGSDLEKAFLQVGIQEPDRDVTRFFWMKDAQLPTVDNNVQIYRFKRVCFGIKSSPFLLEVTVKYHLSQEESPVARLIAENIYVDNVIVGLDSAEEAISFYHEAKSLFQKISMNLREFMSNSQEVMAQIPDFDKVNSSVAKVLGLSWNFVEDTLTVKCPKIIEDRLTKRTVMKSLASVFDPLGLVAPAVLPGKLLIQDLWKHKMEWDQDLPPEFASRWMAILGGFEDMSVARFPQFCPSPEVHIFVDASSKAYAAVAFLRQNIGDKFRAHLVFAKSRLAPVKQKVTIPRLELLGILIGCRQLTFLLKEMNLPASTPCTIWTDSECCLHWLKTTKPLARFVENRVKEIKSIHNSISGHMEFSFVSGTENPADLATRGTTFSELKSETQWWFGPSWLSEKSLPQWNIPPVSKDLLSQIEAELKKSAKPVGIELGINSVLFQNVPIDVKRFSTLKKLLNTTVYCFRFLKKMLWRFLSNNKQQQLPFLRKLFNPIQQVGPILFKEIKSARYFWDVVTQQESFRHIFEVLEKPDSKQELSVIRQLGLHMDQDGLLRCGGRLAHSALPDAAKFPKLLPKDSEYTRLIILEAHQQSTGEFSFHCGVQQTLAEVRREYWIIQGRQAVRNVLKLCTICKKFQGGPFRLPQMPAIPAERVTRAFPFEFTGLDYLGPVWYKLNDQKEKAWICLFTCLVIRAIHLELVKDMSAQEFLNALRRFVARRGPKKILSDNASQFKLVSDTVHKAWREMVTSEDVISYCHSRAIEWQFITPFAPWQGGVYERMVGLVKSAFKKAVGRKLLTFSQLSTLLPEMEAVVNTRPLTYIYDDVNSPLIIRPLDFLCSRGSVGAPDFDEDPDDPDYHPKLDARDKLLKFWKSSQVALDKFWTFWKDEYLASLRERTKVDHDQPRNLSDSFPKRDDVVLVHEDMVPRGSWKLGRIQKLNIGHDGNIRSAELLMPNKSIISRPINKLYPVEVAEALVSPLQQSVASNSGSIQSEKVARNWKVPVLSDSIQTLFTVVLCLTYLGGFVDCLQVNRTYVMCSGGRAGHALHIPNKIQCKLPENKPLEKKLVVLWVQRDEPMRTSGYRCYIQNHKIFTRTGVFWSKGIIGDTTSYTAVTSHICWDAVTSKLWQGQQLVEVSPGFWSSNITLVVKYKWCCYDVVSEVTNFNLEQGEVASLDGKTAVTDLQDISSCKPDVGFCQGYNGIVVWNGTRFEAQCAFKIQGQFNATMSGNSLVVEALQGAFSFSGKTFPRGAECVPQDALYTDQGAVFIQFINGTPNVWLKKAHPRYLLTNDPLMFHNTSHEDLSNYKRSFLYDKLIQVERQQFALVWHQLCLLKQGQLDIALQLLRIDATLGVRALLGRDDIHAEFHGEAVQLWTCRNVTPAIIHFSGKFNGTCYMYTPVQLKPGSPLLFVNPGSRDLIESSPFEDCGHATAHIFQGDDGQFYTVHGLVHVTELPVEIHWQGLWNTFTFDAPSLFHNKLATLFSAFHQPRFASLRLYQVEQTLNRLVNYTAAMSLDPEVISEAISGVGEGIGHILSGAGEGIGHVISGVATGVENLFNGLLKGPLQVLINVLVIGALIIGSIFVLWKLRLTKCSQKTTDRFTKDAKQKSETSETKESKIKEGGSEYALEWKEDSQMNYQLHFAPNTSA